ERLAVMPLAHATVTPRRRGRLCRFDVLRTLHLVTGKVPTREFSDCLQALLQGQGEILAGSSELPSGRGVTVRILGRHVAPVAAALQVAVAAARATILGTACYTSQ